MIVIFLFFYPRKIFNEMVVTMADEEITCGAEVRKKLAGIRNHFVLCGYGRVGAAVCRELKKRNQMAVIIEKERKIVEKELWEDPDFLQSLAMPQMKVH